VTARRRSLTAATKVESLTAPGPDGEFWHAVATTSASETPRGVKDIRTVVAMCSGPAIE
jgi:hypothetical protein